MAKTREELQSLWRQGAILAPDSHTHLLDKAHIEIQPTDHLLVLNQTCDLIQTDHSKEPFIELLPLHTLARVDNGLLGGKVSRALHMQLPETIGQLGPFVGCYPFERFFADHALIEEIIPMGYLDALNVSCITDWLYMRYNRVALPTAYVDRIDDKSKDKLLRKFRNLIKVREVRIKIEPMIEQNDDQIYVVEMLVVMDDADFYNQETISANQKLLDEIESIYNSLPGIETGDRFYLQCMSEITYDVIDEFAKLDLAYLSYREGDEAAFSVGPG